MDMRKLMNLVENKTYSAPRLNESSDNFLAELDESAHKDDESDSDGETSSDDNESETADNDTDEDKAD